MVSRSTPLFHFAVKGAALAVALSLWMSLGSAQRGDDDPFGGLS